MTYATGGFVRRMVVEESEHPVLIPEPAQTRAVVPEPAPIGGPPMWGWFETVRRGGWNVFVIVMGVLLGVPAVALAARIGWVVTVWALTL